MSHVSSAKKLVRSSAIMAAGTLISRVLGVLRVILITFILGTATRQSDILALATMVPNSLYILFAGGALNTVLVPQIVRHIKKDDDKGEAYTNRIMTAFMLIVTAVAIIATAAAPLVTRIYSSSDWRAPELADQYASMVVLTYLTLPQIFFYGAFFLLGQILNARDKFGPMMWAPIANNVVSILTLSVYFLVWGNGNDHSLAFTTPQLLVLGLGSTVGIAVQTLVLLFFVRKVGFRLRPRFDLKGTGLGHTFSLTKWTLGFVAVNQVALMVVNRLATSATATGHGAGANVYANAHLIWILPHSLITVSLATAMLPNASRLAAEGKLGDVGKEMTNTVRMALVVIVPATVAFISLAGPISGLLFAHGAGADDAGLIAWTLIAFAVGLIPFTVQFVCLRTFYALEDTRTPFFLQVLIAGINAGGALLLVWAVSNPSFVAAALALAYSLAYSVGVFASWNVLKRRLPTLSGGALMMHAARLLAGAGLGGVAAYYASILILDQIPHNLWGNLVAGIAGGLLILGFYWLVGRLLKVSELRDVTRLLSARFGKGKAPAGKNPSTGDRGGGNAPGPALLVEDRVPTILHRKLDDDDLRRLDEEKAHAQTTRSPGRNPWRHLPLDEIPSPQEGAPASPENAGEDTPPVAEDLSRPPAPRLASEGTVLQARYQLLALLTAHHGAETWRAHDQVLSRDVVVHVLGTDDPRADTLLAAAQRGAVATEARFLRILDAGILDDPELRIGAYVVCEYAPGISLARMLRSGPLSPVEAGWVTHELADTLAGLHAQGQFLERITPDTVVITVSGTVRVVGFSVESALASPDGEPAPGRREDSDIEALGVLLYAMLVRRWPYGNQYGLPPAPVAKGRIAAPSELRDGIPPALDRLCLAVMGGRGSYTARDLAHPLTQFLGTADASATLAERVSSPGASPAPVSTPATEAEAAPSAPTRTRPVAEAKLSEAAPSFPQDRHREPALPLEEKSPRSKQRVVALVIAAVALVVLVVSLLIGALRNTEETGSPAPTVASGEVGPLTIAEVRDFDPSADGGNDEENPDQTGNAVDGDPETAWETLRYRNRPDLGGLKPGVGLVVDLGQPREVSAVGLTLAGDGTAVDVRVPAGETASMATSTDWNVVASEAAAPSGLTTLTPAEPVTTRYLLVYLTALPSEEGGYRGAIGEIVVTGR